MKKNRFPAVMTGLTVLSGSLAVIFFWVNGFSARGSLGACAVTCLTLFYHLAMRLAVGGLVPNRFDYRSPWFQPRPWEQATYRRLKVKQWKKHVPSYDPRLFSLEEYTLPQILCHMCQAEVVHEIIVLLSFVPLLFGLVFGEYWVFLLTSLGSAGLDLVFVVLQRSNRPRLVRLLEKQSRGS